MPYDSVSDLPKTIRDKYGSCARVFRGAFSSAYEKHGEARAFAVAHEAAQRCQKKEASMTFDSAADELRGPKFNIITKALAAGTDPEGKRRFRATASSTIVDLKGDEIQLPALQKLAEQFRQGVGVFMDHDRSTGSAFGVTDGAEIVQRGMDAAGTPVWDLDITGIVNTPNPRAAQLADSIDGGYVKLGASVTAFVRKHLRNPKSGGMLISDLDAIEVSIVGVPENQRSWTQKAVMAVKSFYKNEEESPVDQDETNVEATAAETPDDAGAEPAGALDTPAAPEAAPVVTKQLDTTGAQPDDTGTPAADEAAESNSDQASAEESGSEPETPSGETPASTPDAEGADTPVTEKAFEPGEVAELLGHVSKLVEALGERDQVIVQKDADIAALQTKIAQYEADAGSITEEVDAAKQVIEKVLAMPLRSQTAGYVEKGLTPGSLFARVSPDIADYLNKRSKLNGN